MYTPLGIKTDYSLLKSLIKIDDLILYAKKNNLKSLGILDNNLCSVRNFYLKCLNNNIKPIIGLEIVLNTKIYLYPKNYNALVSLYKLHKKYLDNDLKVEDLHEEDIIVVLPEESHGLKDTFSKNDIYLSYQSVIDYQKSNEKNKIYINDILALDKNSSKYINYLYLIDKNKTLGDMELINYEDKVLDIKDIDNSYFTDLINIEFNNNKTYIPHYDESIKDSYEYLSNLALKGLLKRFNGKVDKVYQERLKYELKTINKMGFTDYFLIVFDYVRYAIKNNIFVGAGRGSAAGSLVAYSLGITWIDPIKYDLLFERFLNPDRVTMPDIDVDFEYTKRDQVVDYVKMRYKETNVAKIMTFGTMTAKEVLRSVAKINHVDEKTITNFLKHVDSKKSLHDNYKNINDILKRNYMLEKVYNESYYLEGLKKHIGTHAAGVIISSTDLTNVIPLIKSGDELLTGYTMNELEDLGLLKMDFLSIKNLTIIANIINAIKKNVDPQFDIYHIPLDDKLVFDLFKKGETIGIFQFESRGMISFLKQLKPETFSDLVMAIAIYRPGPMDNIDLYLNRKNKGFKITYIDPSLEPILKSTYGILIYQEQIMEILRSLGNFTYSEADIIRRAISKKKYDVINDAKDKFINNAIKNNVSSENATKIFDLILKFADFGFNKSHSVAYSYIAYQMAYLKAHFKEYYYISLLNTNIGGEVKTKEYIDEAKSIDIHILKPDINLSKYEYTKETDGIRLPLKVIKGIGDAVCNNIIEEQKKTSFTSIFDLLSRINIKSINKKAFETLAKVGVFDSFNINRATIVKNIDALFTYSELVRDLDESLVSEPVLETVLEYSDAELMQFEKDLLGYYISVHPSNKYPKCIKHNVISKYYNKTIKTAVLIENIKYIKTKNNKDMAFIKASDETQIFEYIAFDNIVLKLKEFKAGDFIGITGVVEKRNDAYQIVIKDLKSL